MVEGSLRPGSAQNPHVLRVRSGFSALSGLKMANKIA
ncbi:L-asparaginase [Escherichia coli]|nr:L-asparaginase [Escherichia coli]EGE2355703.1 L-asparaginase [Escherichia coli]